MTETLRQVDRLPLTVVVTVARLRLLPRILHGGSPMLRMLLDFQWNRGWTALLRNGFRWMRRYMNQTGDAYGFDDDSFIRLARDHRHDYLKMISRTAACAKRNWEISGQVIMWRKAIQRTYKHTSAHSALTMIDKRLDGSMSVEPAPSQ